MGPCENKPRRSPTVLTCSHTASSSSSPKAGFERRLQLHPGQAVEVQILGQPVSRRHFLLGRTQLPQHLKQTVGGIRHRKLSPGQRLLRPTLHLPP